MGNKTPYTLDPENRLPVQRFQYVEVLFRAGGQDVEIKHRLAPVNAEEVRYKICRLSAPAVIYQDLTPTRKPWQRSHIFLRASQPVAARILLFLEAETDAVRAPMSGPLVPSDDVCQETFATIAVPGAEEVTADVPCDTLVLVPGEGIAISTAPETNTIIISSTCCEESNFCDTLCNVYAQNWADGEGDVGFSQDAYVSSAFGGSDPPDSIYPELRASEAVRITPNLGPNGEQVLDSNGGGDTGVVTGTFAKSTTTGLQSVTGLGIRPTGLLLWTGGLASAGFADHVERVMGVSDGTNDGCTVMQTTGNTALFNDCDQSHTNTGVLRIISGVPATTAEASVDSLDPDGFTLNWTSNTGTASIIHYLAFANPIEAFCGTFDEDSGAGTSKAVTGVGFEPDLVIFIGGHPNTLTLDDTRSGNEFAFGMMNAAGEQFTVATTVLDGANEARRYQSTAECLRFFGDAVTGIDDALTFSSMDADGFTVGVSGPSADQRPVFFLALKGILNKIGAFNQATGTGTQATTGVGFAPQAVLFSSFCNVTSAGVPNDVKLSIGAADVDSQSCMWDGHIRGSLNSQCGRNVRTTSCILLASTNATVASSTIDAEAELSSLDADGWTLDWTTADATAREVCYLALAGTGVGETNYADAGVWLQPTNTWDGSSGCVTLNYYPTNEAYAELESLTAPLATLIDSTSADALSLSLELDVLDNPKLVVSYKSWNGGSPTTVNSFVRVPSLGRAAALNQWHEIQLQWGAGGAVIGSGGVNHVNSDGFFRVFVTNLDAVDGEAHLVHEEENIDLLVDAVANRLSGIQIGYPGLFGRMTNLIVKGPCGGLIDPSTTLPALHSYAPGSTIVQNGKYLITAKRIEFAAAERITLQGTAHWSHIN